MAPEPGQPDDGPQIAAAVQEISERASVLVREEIELAKAEVAEKITKILRGTAVGAAAGVFAIFGLVILLEGIAWLLYALFFDDVYWGFFIVAGGLFVLAGLSAFLAVRWLKSGAPPTPDMAIDEAQRIRQTITGEPGGQLDAVEARSEAGITAEPDITVESDKP